MARTLISVFSTDVNYRYFKYHSHVLLNRRGLVFLFEFLFVCIVLIVLRCFCLFVCCGFQFQSVRVRNGSVVRHDSQCLPQRAENIFHSHTGNTAGISFFFFCLASSLFFPMLLGHFKVKL